MSVQGASRLQLPTAQQTRSIILSYLIHHGHKDTARAFMAEVARREATESIENCPLWAKQQNYSGSNNSMDATNNVVTSALDHMPLGTDKRTTVASTLSTRGSNMPGLSHKSENVLEDAAVRRVIRNKILSGQIDDAIEIITHHLPSFLPIATPDSEQSASSNLRSGSHEPSQTRTILTSSVPPASPSSGATTPVESTPEPQQPQEKSTNKNDAPTTQVLPTGSPKQVDLRDAPALHQASQRSTSSGLGRSVNPAHILLNLRVQQFLEAVRTVPLVPDQQEQPHNLRKSDELDMDIDLPLDNSPTDTNDLDVDKSSLPTQYDIRSAVRQRHLFELASRLYQSAQGLKSPRDREVYAKEVEQVCSLMIGPSPENSLASPYLSMARREALADQVNSSMLHYIGEPPAPALQIWAQTTKVVWDQILASHIVLPRGTDIPADVKMYASYVVRGVGEGDERSQTVSGQPFDFAALARA